MYSGQEIVSQEECKIVLADFYEGVDCYNATDNTIKFTLLDWATATYDSETLTLETRNFSCKPVIVSDIRVTFEAGIPEGVTGLEVVMHTDSYEKLRIMPIRYLPTCNRIEWSDPYGDFEFGDWAYVDRFCNENGNTIVEVRGEIDSVTVDSVVVVGYNDSLTDSIGPLTIQFADVNEQIVNITPIFSTELKDVLTYEYDAESGELKEVWVQREVTTITVAAATSIVFSGLYNYTASLYDCTYLTNVGNIVEFCEITLPTPETRVTMYAGSSYEEIDGWATVTGSFGTTEFRLLPSMTFLRQEGDILFFAGATQIEFKSPVEKVYDIFRCSDEPYEFGYFYIYPVIRYEVGETNTAFTYIDIYFYGEYTIDGNCIVDEYTGDRYCFFYGNNVPVDLTEHTVNNSVLSILIPWCNGYYTLNGGAQEEIPIFGYPFSSDFRTVWDPVKCKFIVTCESIGWFPCPCIECEDQPDGESARIWLDKTTDQACTSYGIDLGDETVRACEAGWQFSLGVYPDIPLTTAENTIPTAAQTTVEHVYFRGLTMYYAIPTLVGFTYYTPVGNLAYGVEPRVIEDTAAISEKEVNILPFIYLTVFKFPFKYVREDSLNTFVFNDWDIWTSWWEQRICWDSDTFGEIPCFGWEYPPCEKNWPPVSYCDDPDYGKTPEELAMDGISEAPLPFDFKIELQELLGRLEPSWSGPYDWGRSCGWKSVRVTRSTTPFDRIIDTSNTWVLDELKCEDDISLRYVTSNLTLGYIKPPLAAYGSYQDKYDEYVEAVELLISEDAEAYGYYNKIYAEGIDLEEPPPLGGPAE